MHLGQDPTRAPLATEVMGVGMWQNHEPPSPEQRAGRGGICVALANTRSVRLQGRVAWRRLITKWAPSIPLLLRARCRWYPASDVHLVTGHGSLSRILNFYSTFASPYHDHGRSPAGALVGTLRSGTSVQPNPAACTKREQCAEGFVCPALMSSPLSSCSAFASPPAPASVWGGRCCLRLSNAWFVGSWAGACRRA